MRRGRMEKLQLGTPNLISENIEKIAELFPQVITEAFDDNGELKRAVDFYALKQELTDEIVEGNRERYQFTWPGKQAAKLEARRSINKTLRPCRDESVDFNTTENLYIEGDNLDALKLLRNTYAGKIKMIYIDPPYNTGNDFIYNDDYSESLSEYAGTSADYDEEGGRLIANLSSNGRFHSDWCSMMYPRLLLAKDLLTIEGVLFISIDDNELMNLKKITDEIFGEKQFIGCFVWKRRSFSAMDQSKASTDHEYVIAYHRGVFKSLRGIDKDFHGYTNPDNDPRGPWTIGDLTVGMNGDMRPNQFYDLVDPKTEKVYRPNYNRVWSYTPESMKKLIDEDRVIFPEDTSKRPMRKRFANELKSETNPFSTWMTSVGMNSEGTRVANALFDNITMFNYAKPVSLLKSLIQQATISDSIVLDFFSGSATTAHAVMQLNAEDNGKRKFIMVQLPEVCAKETEAAKAGYKNICEIGKERIRRAAKSIEKDYIKGFKAPLQSHVKKGGSIVPMEPIAFWVDGAENIAETKTIVDQLDFGFRVLKIDSSNFEDTHLTPDSTEQTSLSSLAGNMKLERSAEDLLFEVLPAFRIPLTAKIVTETIGSKQVFNVNNKQLLACFDIAVTTETVEEIAKLKPLYAVFRDASFANDSAAANFEELFKTYSPDTVRKVV